LLLLKTAFNEEFLLAWFRRFLEKKGLLGYQYPEIEKYFSKKISEFKNARCVVKKPLLVKSSLSLSTVEEVVLVFSRKEEDPPPLCPWRAIYKESKGIIAPLKIWK